MPVHSQREDRLSTGKKVLCVWHLQTMTHTPREGARFLWLPLLQQEWAQTAVFFAEDQSWARQGCEACTESKMG